MIRRNLIFLLLILLLNQIYVNAMAHDYAPRNVDIARSSKNILVGSFVGGRSHIKPMLDIAAILIERGHDVTLLTSGNYTSLSEYPTIKQFTLGPPLNYKGIFEKEGHKEFDYSVFSKYMGLGINAYIDIYKKYKNFAEDHNIDLFICDGAMNEACSDVANTLKKPVIGFSSFFRVAPHETHKSDPIFNCNISLENESFFERFKCIIINPLRSLYIYYPLISQLNNERKKAGVETNFDEIGILPKVSLYLIDNFFGFDLPQSLPPNVLEIGPVLSDEFPLPTPELTDFINAHERILYVAFGTRFFTTTENNNKLLQSFVEAINKNIIDSVVWSLVQTSKDNYSSTLNLTDGTQIQTSPILNNEHPHIYVSKFAPQFSVLNHTNTKLFLSHGGTNSVHESLYTGTPLLVLPLNGDQMGNAEKLKSAGVSLMLNKKNLDVNDIINKMDTILKDENIKKNSKRIEFLTKINSKRKYRAADLIEYILYSSNLNEGVDEKFLNEFVPAGLRMGFIRGNNYDILGALLGIIIGFIGGILWIVFKLIRFIVKTTTTNQKPKRE